MPLSGTLEQERSNRPPDRPRCQPEAGDSDAPPPHRNLRSVEAQRIRDWLLSSAGYDDRKKIGRRRRGGTSPPVHDHRITTLESATATCENPDGTSGRSTAPSLARSILRSCVLWNGWNYMDLISISVT